MKTTAFEMLVAVIKAQEIVDELPSYRHLDDCGKKRDAGAECSCGTERTNLKLQKLKGLLTFDSSHIKFAGD